ncbi:MAG: Maf family protein [Planctomycetota bacterium]|nr:Maf family protein [Planctomycetota bacterium]
MRLYLASRSESRRRLLMGAGFDVVVVEPEYEEPPPFLPASCYVVEMAQQKANSVVRKVSQMKGRIILAADTVVECNGELLGKPRDVEEARTILRRCSGREQRVLTGVCVMDVEKGSHLSGFEAAVVQMKVLSEVDIEKIIKEGRSLGKAGAYAIREDSPDEFVELLQGSHDTIIGLPLGLVKGLLSQLGV